MRGAAGLSGLSALPPLREVIARHALSASKALGQNFLLDEKLLDRIAAIPGSLDGQQVLEIGPGPGGLTRALLRAGAHVTAIEMDRRCLPALAELGEAFPGRLRVIEGDALKLNHAIVGPFHIVANLPYNVGTALLVGWLGGEAWPPQWASLTLMFQEEVARRIVSAPDTSAYGRLAVLAQWRSTARLALKVHRSAFTPPPKVMSAVIRLTRNERQQLTCDEALFQKVVKQGFQNRRKTLRNALKPLNLPSQIVALALLDLRAEQLSVEDFISLTLQIEQAGGVRSV